MKCPYCGSELSKKDVCAGCGKKTELSNPSLEVEYKEFKISEFLEIRQKPEIVQTEQEPSGPTKTDYRTTKDGATGETRRAIKREKSNFFLITAIIIVIITAAAGAWYLLRFFIK
jgi:rRNA maturation protein Nop10